TLMHRDSAAIEEWLVALDRDPTQLDAIIDAKPTFRLGHYAERLMTFYFRHKGVLVGHGVQVQSLKNGTVGEFDFLLRDGDALAHWEFATKFYLLAPSDQAATASYFVGPNLADTLNAKMHKILQQQLLLAHHPAAQVHLPQSVNSAKALIKGWLFYRRSNREECPVQLDGISAEHCRGFWCTATDWELEDGKCAIVLPRLQWLAPAKVPFSETSSHQSIKQTIQEYFKHDSMPLLIAVLERQGNNVIEIDRGFIVPDDWPDQAKQYLDRVNLVGSV
ncbi:MAG: DUF1853 family protein, partial [Burkholderiaceae bacterium]